MPAAHNPNFCSVVPAAQQVEDEANRSRGFGPDENVLPSILDVFLSEL